MTMRYHWGLGIGHTYSHSRDIRSHQYSTPPPVDPPETSPDQEICSPLSVDPPQISHGQDIRYSTPSSAEPPEIEEALPPATGDLLAEVEAENDSELCDSDQEDEDYSDSGATSSDSDEGENSETDDDEFLEIYDTYNSD